MKSNYNFCSYLDFIYSSTYNWLNLKSMIKERREFSPPIDSLEERLEIWEKFKEFYETSDPEFIYSRIFLGDKHQLIHPKDKLGCRYKLDQVLNNILSWPEEEIPYALEVYYNPVARKSGKNPNLFYPLAYSSNNSLYTKLLMVPWSLDRFNELTVYKVWKGNLFYRGVSNDKTMHEQYLRFGDWVQLNGFESLRHALKGLKIEHQRFNFLNRLKIVD